MSRTWILFVGLLAVIVLFAGCGVEGITDVTPTAPLKPTEPFTPVVLQPTNTPVPPPPTPTPRPTSTPAPTQAAAPTDAGAAAAPTAAPKAGVDTPMVEIKGASFSMGSDAGNADSKPPHQVQVESFMLDTFEVTNADFKKFVDAAAYKTDAEKNGSSDNWLTYAKDKDDHPVVKISWNDAKAFCEWADKRLPTEAEWEFAARGDKGFTFPWGNEFDAKKANVKASGLRGTTAVGSFPAGASPFGIQDMSGNVAEWTSTVPEHYPGNTTNSKLYGTNLFVLRGGGWFSPEEQVTTFFRNSNVPIAGNDDLGFRCAK